MTRREVEEWLDSNGYERTEFNIWKKFSWPWIRLIVTDSAITKQTETIFSRESRTLFTVKKERSMWLSRESSNLSDLWIDDNGQLCTASRSMPGAYQ